MCTCKFSSLGKVSLVTYSTHLVPCHTSRMTEMFLQPARTENRIAGGSWRCCALMLCCITNTPEHVSMESMRQCAHFRAQTFRCLAPSLFCRFLLGKSTWVRLPSHSAPAVSVMQRESAQLLRILWRSCISAHSQLAVNSRTTTILPSLASWSAVPVSGSLCTPSTASLVPYIRPAFNHYQRGFAANARPPYRTQQPANRKIDPSGVQGLYLVAFTVAMIGVTYASVPLYRMFCQATGYGGTVQQGSTGDYLLTAVLHAKKLKLCSLSVALCS